MLNYLRQNEIITHYVCCLVCDLPIEMERWLHVDFRISNDSANYEISLFIVLPIETQSYGL